MAVETRAGAACGKCWGARTGQVFLRTGNILPHAAAVCGMVCGIYHRKEGMVARGVALKIGICLARQKAAVAVIAGDGADAEAAEGAVAFEIKGGAPAGGIGYAGKGAETGIAVVGAAVGKPADVVAVAGHERVAAEDIAVGLAGNESGRGTTVIISPIVDATVKETESGAGVACGKWIVRKGTGSVVAETVTPGAGNGQSLKHHAPAPLAAAPEMPVVRSRCQESVTGGVAYGDTSEASLPGILAVVGIAEGHAVAVPGYA